MTEKKAAQQRVLAQRETEEQIGGIASAMVKAGTSKELTLVTLRLAAAEFLEEYSGARGVRHDRPELMAQFIAEKVLASSVLDVFQRVA